MTKFTITPEMDALLREHYQLPANELAAVFNKAFGSDRTSQQVHSYRKVRGLRTGRTGRFYKGQSRPTGSGATKPTSTSFKKGDAPANLASIGDEVVTKDGYIRVKIAQPDIWVFKHRQVWERANGDIPCGMVIWFKDQDPKNCQLKNLKLIPRSLQVRFNKLKMTKQPEELRETFELIAQLQERAGKWCAL